MAAMSRCVVCIHCDGIKLICDKYKQGIPKDILNESKDCEFYKKRNIEYTESDSDLPLAKGR